MGIEVIGKSTDAFTYIDEADIFIAIGTNTTREKLHEKLVSAGASIPTLIHPNSVIGPEVELNAGSVVMAGVVINSSTKIGRGCIINTGTIIEHDCVLEDFVHISPGV
jgi:UDP-3-O-[3-hydroxymyristoyl] glucosamine N-acyltransferase